MRIAEVFLPCHAWLPGPIFDVLRGAVAATGVVIASGVTGLEPLTATTNNLLSIGAILGFTALYSATGELRSVVATAIALVVLADLGSVQTAWFLSLMFGAGMGSVLVMRWLWEGINPRSELAAIATSLVVAPTLLFTTSEEWLRLGVMAAATTAAAIGVTWITRRTDVERLRAFYRRVRPVGFWGRTARAEGEAAGQPAARLARGLVAPSPERAVWRPLVAIGAGVALVPAWWEGAGGVTEGRLTGSRM